MAARCERVKELLLVGTDPNICFPPSDVSHLPGLSSRFHSYFARATSQDVTPLVFSILFLITELRIAMATIAESSILESYDPAPNEPPNSEIEDGGWPRVRCHQSVAPQWVIIVLLLRAGADPNQAALDRVPLSWAVDAPCCRYPLLRLLCFAGADIFNVQPSIIGRLWRADLQLIRQVTVLGSRFNANDEPPFHHIAALQAFDRLSARDLGLLELMLEAGYDIDQVWKGETALTLAIQRRSIDMVRWLINHGASVTTGGFAGTPVELVESQTPQIYAAVHKIAGVPTGKIPAVQQIALDMPIKLR